MKKGADAFRSIGETAKVIGVPPHVLRYWETQFSQLKPMKRADGRRYYRPDDVRLAAGLCEILRDDGMTIRGAKKLLSKDRGESVRARGEERLATLQTADTSAGSPRKKTASKRTQPKRADPTPAPAIEKPRDIPQMVGQPRIQTPTQPLPLFPDLTDETKDNGADWLPSLVAFTAKLRNTKRLTAAPRRKATLLRDTIAGLY